MAGHLAELINVLKSDRTSLIVFDERAFFRKINRAWSEEADRQWALFHEKTSRIAREAGALIVILLDVASPEKLTQPSIRRFGAADMYADVIWFMKNIADAENESELTVSKNREGPTGAFQLHWDSDVAAFK